MKKIIFSVTLCFLLGMIGLSAQEIKNDTLSRSKSLLEKNLLPDSASLKLPVTLDIPLEMPPVKMNLTSQQEAMLDSLRRLDELPYDLDQVLPPKFKPGLFFSPGASRFDMPVIGTVTTFSPALGFQATEKLSLYGGVSFSQYHNMSYIQNIIAPGWPVKSNITSQFFTGASYQLHDRFRLHATYQHSLYNQLPHNMMMFSPAYNTMSVGVDVDVWNGLGARIEHVWEFDKYGRMRKGMRYSPMIDVTKFLKFLGY